MINLVRFAVATRKSVTFVLLSFCFSPRYIPACAGRRNSSGDGAGGTSPSVRGRVRHGQPGAGIYRHIPRACGAEAGGNPTVYLHTGTSPQVRGGERHRSWRRRAVGYIPARAGRRDTRRRDRVDIKVHPRACGAEIWFRAHPWGSKGSSPRVRGGVRNTECDGVVTGCIPSRARRSPWQIKESLTTTVHPRACGAESFPRVPS